MIDLIIPYYNNSDELDRTIDSIDDDIFKITIVDDGSEIKPPIYYKVYQYWNYKMNRGPGFARQYGLDKTHEPYVMFMDVGDVFVSKDVQKRIADIIEVHPEINVFSWSYYYKGQATKDTDNRMHGKVYKRQFLEDHGITFCAESSYMNEDIGFNRACRLLTHFYYMNEPVIKWIEDPNSLTQKDNQASLYRDQTRALSLNAIHAIEIGRRNKVNVAAEINQIAIALYYWFLRTIIERPQFAEEAWNGARIFYIYFHKDIAPRALALGNPEVKKCLELRKYLKTPINILNFAKEMQHCENCPNYYLTFSEN